MPSLREFEGPCYRAVTARVQGFRSEGDGEPPVLFGHFAVFNQPTVIQSFMEGNFIERFAPGAFKKTIGEGRESMKVLFQHGFDYLAGDKPLGPIQELREDEEGVYYEVPLLVEALYVQEILPGLREKLYGASFCFRSVQELFKEDPGVSAANPKGLPERTVTEAAVSEFGPVTFPAYSGASAGVRSIQPVSAPCVSLTDLVALKGDQVSDEERQDWMRRDPKRFRSLVSETQQKRSVVTYKETPTSEAAWDGPANRANLPSPLSAETAREAFAWIDETRIDEGNIPKDACRFVHHLVAEDGTVGDADTQACSTGIGVLNGEMQGTTIPDEDRQGVYDHLAHHLRDAGKEPAELKDRSAEPIEAEARGGGEEAISALVEAGFSPESVAEALDVNALRKESSEPPAEGTPEPATEAGDREAEEALPGAEVPHSGRSRDDASNEKQTPPWRQSGEPTPPWRSAG
jgi:hypothetical protein